jgi:hypothetical protein
MYKVEIYTYVLGFIHFLSEDSERGKLQRNEFRGIGYFYPS